jgi:Phosphatidylinositol-specific phospholipase C, X domain
MSGWIQMFYVGGDNGLWTRSRNPDSETWTAEASLGGNLTSQPVAAMIPGTDVLEVFYRGGDNALWTRWASAGAYWSDEVSLGGNLTSDPVAAVLPGTDILHLFYRGGDNALWTRWRDPTTTPNWSDEVSLGGNLTSDPLAIAIPGTDILQVFYRGGDNALWTRWRDPATTPNWSDEVSLGGGLNGDPVAAAPVVAVSPVNWMAQLSGTSELSQLTLPGTHESCTAGLIPEASCQNWDLGTQLQYGIRYVDIRCRNVQDAFAIYHEFIPVGSEFEGVRDVCVDFLTANPTECIVMQVKKEGDDLDSQLTFQQVFDGYTRGFESFFYLDDHIPTLGEVRGKIVVIRRFDVDIPGTVRGLWPAPWQDDATFNAEYTTADGETFVFHIQDQYNLSSADISPKWNAISALLAQARTSETPDWYINFTSASNSAALVFPDGYADKINPQLSDYLANDGPFAARLGTLMMDFPDANMIGSIISLNTNK